MLQSVMAEACAKERDVVCTIWDHMELLLGSNETSTVALIRGLTVGLPDLDSLSCKDLPVLARLHVSSAANMTTTMRLFAPAAFSTDACEPDMSALAHLGTGVLDMVAVLIELQLFHLQRAAALTALSRHKLTELQLTAAASAGPVSSSSSSGGGIESTTDSEKQTLCDVLLRWQQQQQQQAGAA